MSRKYCLLCLVLTIMYSNCFGITDQMIIRETLKGTDYNIETGKRNTSWECPDDYSFDTTVYEGVPLEILKKNNAVNVDKVVLMLHGGGYVGAMNDHYNDFMLNYSKASNGATIIAPDYRVARDDPCYMSQGQVYAPAFEDAILSYEYILSQGYASENIIVGGDSAGGGLAIALTMYLRDHDMRLPKAVMGMSAWTNLTLSSASYTERKGDDPIFGANGVLQKCAQMYAGQVNPSYVYISPYYGEYYDFPSMYLTVGTREMLYNDTVDVIQKARQAGVDVTEHIYEGMIHDCQSFGDLIPEAQDAWNDVRNFFDSIWSNK